MITVTKEECNAFDLTSANHYTITLPAGQHRNGVLFPVQDLQTWRLSYVFLLTII